jgi:transcriptional regulator with XRE-family HTH domain
MPSPASSAVTLRDLCVSMRLSSRPAQAAMDDLANNLKTLCSYYSSVSDVCRRLPMNRQQFNKYLSGDAAPSKHNLRRICEFFGVDEQEISLPSYRFAELIELRPRDRYRTNTASLYAPHLDFLLNFGRKDLQLYEGYYFRYFISARRAGQIVRSLFSLQKYKDSYYTKSISRYRMSETGREQSINYRHLGLPILLGDRLYILEYDTLGKDILSYTVLYGADRKRIDLLVGLQANVAGKRSRTPAVSNVIFEYLGHRIATRKALASCGLFEWDSPKVPEWIKRRLEQRNIDSFMWSVPEQ